MKDEKESPDGEWWIGGDAAVASGEWRVASGEWRGKEAEILGDGF
jgi:hypothetical protein